MLIASVNPTRAYARLDLNDRFSEIRLCTTKTAIGRFAPDTATVSEVSVTALPGLQELPFKDARAGLQAACDQALRWNPFSRIFTAWLTRTI